MTAAMHELAQSISLEPGLIWKIWTENQEQSKAGGVYLFSDQASAQDYLDVRGRRLNSFGITGIDARFFDVNQPLTEINSRPLVHQIKHSKNTKKTACTSAGGQHNTT